MKTIQNDTHIMWVDESEDKTVVIAAYPPIACCYEFETLPPDKMSYGEYMRSNPEIPNTKNDIETYSKMMKAHDDNFIKSNDIQDLKESYYYKGRRDEAIKAKSETRFSLEDLLTDFTCKWVNTEKNSIVYNKIKTDAKNYIQSLTKQKEWEFVPQMEEVEEYHKFIGYKEDGSPKHPFIKKPKIENNKVFGSWIKK